MNVWFREAARTASTSTCGSVSRREADIHLSVVSRLLRATTRRSDLSRFYPEAAIDLAKSVSARGTAPMPARGGKRTPRQTHYSHLTGLDVRLPVWTRSISPALTVVCAPARLRDQLKNATQRARHPHRLAEGPEGSAPRSMFRDRNIVDRQALAAGASPLLSLRPSSA